MASPALEKRYGIRVTDLAGKSLRQIMTQVMPEAEVEQRVGGVLRVLESSECLFDLCPVHLPAGRFFCEVFLSPRRDRSGVVSGVVGLVRDVTDVEQARNALWESERRYIELIQGVGEAFYRMSLPDGRYECFSASAETVFGYGSEDFLTRPMLIREILHPDYESYFQEKWSELVGGIVAPTYEYKIVDHQGNERWIVQSNRGVFDRAGRIVAIEGICRDATRQKLAEEALRESEERYRSLYSTMNEGVALHEMLYDAEQRAVDYVILDVNPAYERILGLKREQAIGSRASELYGVDKPPYMGIFAATAASGKPARFETYFAFAAKHFSVSVFSPGRGKFATVFSDITRRVEALEALEENERRYRLLAENVSDVIWTMAPDLRYTYVSPSVTTARGYSVEEAAAQSFETTLTPASFRRAMQELEEANTAGAGRRDEAQGVRMLELEVTRKDGSTVWMEHNVSALYDSDGQVTGYLGVSRDISERKRGEEELQRAFVNLAETVSRALELRDPYTADHQRRVASVAAEVGRRMGMDPDRVRGLQIGALLHDIGKIAVPEGILGKPGALLEQEWRLIRVHPVRGYEILKDAGLPWPAADMALHHHERLDGSGYPDGIGGEELSLEVRILAVCDVAEAMLSHRPYRPARSTQEVLAELDCGRGTKYDPLVVDIVVGMIEGGGFPPDSL